MRTCLIRTLLLILVTGNLSCSHVTEKKEADSHGIEPEIVVRRRDDGTISSVNQVVEGKLVHGVRATYYGDGKTLYSKQTFDHGVKQGPATWYYYGGQVFKQTSFEDGKRQGRTRIYYKNGNLLAEYDSERGIVLPGLKEYTIDGELITNYPGVEFREIDHLASKQRIDLEISCTKSRSGIKFYVLRDEDKVTDRVYLITEKDKALLQYYVRPGHELSKKIFILAEIPTELGNVLSKTYSYELSVSN